MMEVIKRKIKNKNKEKENSLIGMAVTEVIIQGIVSQKISHHYEEEIEVIVNIVFNKVLTDDCKDFANSEICNVPHQKIVLVNEVVI